MDRRMVSWALCLAVGTAGSARAAALLDISVRGSDWVCNPGLRQSHAPELGLGGCHVVFIAGEATMQVLYDWRANRFFGPALPDDTVSLSADARYALSGPRALGGLSPIVLHDLATGVRAEVARDAFAPKLTADGAAVLYGDMATYRTMRWDRATGAREVATDASPHLLAASADGRLVVVRGQAYTLYGQALIDTSTGAREMLCDDSYDPHCFLGLSPDARYVAWRATLPGGARERRLRDRTTGIETALPDPESPQAPLRVVFDPASRRMLHSMPSAACGDGLYVRDLATGTDTPVRAEGACPVRGTPSAFGPDGLVAFSGRYIASSDVLFAHGAEDEAPRYFE